MGKLQIKGGEMKLSCEYCGGNFKVSESGMKYIHIDSSEFHCCSWECAEMSEIMTNEYREELLKMSKRILRGIK